MVNQTPAWDSQEMRDAIAEHDAQADPQREATGQKYTAKSSKQQPKKGQNQ